MLTNMMQVGTMITHGCVSYGAGITDVREREEWGPGPLGLFSSSLVGCRGLWVVLFLFMGLASSIWDCGWGLRAQSSALFSGGLGGPSACMFQCLDSCSFGHL